MSSKGWVPDILLLIIEELAYVMFGDGFMFTVPMGGGLCIAIIMNSKVNSIRDIFYIEIIFKEKMILARK